MSKTSLKYWIAMILLTLITACGTTKKTQSSSTNLQIDTEDRTYTTVEEKSESTRQQTTDKSQSVTEATERETVHTVYDTTLPKDPQTGEHPKQSETRIKEKTKTNFQGTETTVTEETEELQVRFYSRSMRKKMALLRQESNINVVRKNRIGWVISLTILSVALGTLVIFYRRIH